MRKRLLIGAISVAVIGLAAYFFSKPKEGTVEYHKKAYMGVSHGPVLQWIVQHGPRRVSAGIVGSSRRRLDYHRGSLVRLGYLAELTFPVSNALPETVLNRIKPSV